jgi:hypothetical protein
MIYSFDHNMDYVPAIPIAEIAIRYATNAPEVSLSAIVDSGADATIIPMQFLRRVRARKGEKAWMRGPALQRMQVDRYWVAIRVGGHMTIHVQVVGDNQGEESILGRDVLNQLIVTLNGLAAVVEISD